MEVGIAEVAKSIRAASYAGNQIVVIFTGKYIGAGIFIIAIYSLIEIVECAGILARATEPNRAIRPIQVHLAPASHLAGSRLAPEAGELGGGDAGSPGVFWIYHHRDRIKTNRQLKEAHPFGGTSLELLGADGAGSVSEEKLPAAELAEAGRGARFLELKAHLAVSTSFLIGLNSCLHHRKHGAGAADAQRSRSRRLGNPQGQQRQESQREPGKAQIRAHNGHNHNRTLGDPRAYGG